MTETDDGDADGVHGVADAIPWRASVPLTPIDAGDRDLKGLHAYMTACASQAQIALVHLGRVWSREGEPADLDAWRSVADPIELWADLQGAMTPGMVLSRLLRPAGVRPRPPLSKLESVRLSEARGRMLRDLLEVHDDSVLLTISEVRDPLEHIDERMDGAVEDEAVCSISDLYVAHHWYFHEIRGRPDVEFGGGSHANMRTFLPLPGVLVYGRVHLDLFAYEARLLSLLEAVPRARQTIEARRKVQRRVFGSSRPLLVDLEQVQRRRAELLRLRGDSALASLRSTQAVNDPRGIVMVMDEPVDPDLPTAHANPRSDPQLGSR